jgi:hypothetical protein
LIWIARKIFTSVSQNLFGPPGCRESRHDDGQYDQSEQHRRSRLESLGHEGVRR